MPHFLPWWVRQKWIRLRRNQLSRASQTLWSYCKSTLSKHCRIPCPVGRSCSTACPPLTTMICSLFAKARMAKKILQVAIGASFVGKSLAVILHYKFTFALILVNAHSNATFAEIASQLKAIWKFISNDTNQNILTSKWTRTQCPSTWTSSTLRWSLRPILNHRHHLGCFRLPRRLLSPVQTLCTFQQYSVRRWCHSPETVVLQKKTIFRPTVKTKRILETF